jgi:hypothetical protein
VRVQARRRVSRVGFAKPAERRDRDSIDLILRRDPVDAAAGSPLGKVAAIFVIAGFCPAFDGF